jgi:hypothetical protein
VLAHFLVRIQGTQQALVKENLYGFHVGIVPYLYSTCFINIRIHASILGFDLPPGKIQAGPIEKQGKSGSRQLLSSKRPAAILAPTNAEIICRRSKMPHFLLLCLTYEFVAAEIAGFFSGESCKDDRGRHGGLRQDPRGFKQDCDAGFVIVRARPRRHRKHRQLLE